MKAGWGAGTAVAVLLSFAAYLFGLFGPLYSVPALEMLASTAFLLVGLWTLAAAFVVVEAKDRTYYAVWGVVLACLSLFAYVPPAIAVGLLLIAIVVLIFLVLYTGRTQKAFTAATSPSAPAGPGPA